MQNKNIRVVCIGDIVGKPGVELARKWLPQIKKKYNADFTIVNGENSAPNGRGITSAVVRTLKEVGTDVITTGNHVWGQRDSYHMIDTDHAVVRPLNFPSSCPGRGYTIMPLIGTNLEVAVINAQGRIFMHENLSCPFREIENALTYIRTRTNIIIVDFHAEATSEKQGLGYFLDGKVSLLYGTHTHVQTADNVILPQGTGYITDLGCGGALFSMLGMKKESVLSRMVKQMPSRFAVDTQPPFALHGICATIDTQTGKAIEVERIRIIDHDLVV